MCLLLCDGLDYLPKFSTQGTPVRKVVEQIVDLVLDESRNLEEIMAQDDIDVIYKSHRLLPEFDGNPHVLTRFINLCDRIVLAHFKVGPGHELNNLALINGILNKVTGPAARLINSGGISDNWNGIRSALINNFADHRDETALYSDLSMQTQGSSSPQEFYERCQNLYSTIMTYITLNETVLTTIEAKRILYSKLTLQAYLRGLKDPLGSRIRCMRPETMEKALEFVQEELNTLYLQQRNEGPSRKEWAQPSSSIPNYNLPLDNFAQRMPISTPNVPGPSRPHILNNPGPSRPQPIHPTQGWKPHNMPQMQPPRGPSRTQQMFRALPPNYNPQSNVFRMPNKPQQPSFNYGAPRPMSGVSPYVPKHLPPSGHDWRKFGNPPPTNYFKTREVNFNDFEYNYDPQYYYDYDQHDYYQDCTGYEQYPDVPNLYYNYESVPNYETSVVEEVDQDSAPKEEENFQKAPNSNKRK